MDFFYAAGRWSLKLVDVNADGGEEEERQNRGSQITYVASSMTHSDIGREMISYIFRVFF